MPEWLRTDRDALMPLEEFPGRKAQLLVNWRGYYPAAGDIPSAVDLILQIRYS